MDMKTMTAENYNADLSGSKQVCPDSNKAVISKIWIYLTIMLYKYNLTWMSPF